VRILDRELSIEEPKLVEEEPLNLVALFLDAQRHGVTLAARTFETVQRNAHRLEELRGSPEVAATFREILRGRARVAETLRAMHAANVLGQLLPEFGGLYRMVLRDLHHIYTVDEHTLRGVDELEALRLGQYRESFPLLTQVMHEIDRPEVLYLAMLLHDVGKGHGHGHSERGAQRAEEASLRLGLHPDDARQIADLVRHHLTMSRTAQRRDLTDERVILEFARQVGSVELLNKLYVMTFADMRAVAPTVWNYWRDLELGELYLRTREALEEGELVEVGREARAERVRQRLREELGAREPQLRESLERLLRTMPASYFLATPGDLFSIHAGLLRDFERTGEPMVTAVRHFPEREFSEFSVCTRDRPGLFSMIAGVLAAHRINILAAAITTSDDGIALDVFRVSHEEHGRTMEEERWRRVNEVLVRVLRGELEVEELVQRLQAPTILGKSLLPSIATEVQVSNEDSEHYTLVEISTRDALGLLFTITSRLRALGCSIHLAKVSTVLDHVYDVFYVTDLEGRKIEEPERLREIQAELRRALEPAERREEAPRAVR
jgi:[protein-PII] uridylyltransferase